MKKHELLEKAMRDYPKGCVAIFKSAPNVRHTSDGLFRVKDYYEDDKKYLVVNSGNNTNCFYDNGEWAEIVTEEKPKEIEVKLYAVGRRAKVTLDRIEISQGAIGNFVLAPSDIEDISHAIKSLQP